MTNNHSLSCKCGGAAYGHITTKTGQYAVCKRHWWEYDAKFNKFFEQQYQKQWGDKAWFINKIPPKKRQMILL